MWSTAWDKIQPTQTSNDQQQPSPQPTKSTQSQSLPIYTPQLPPTYIAQSPHEYAPAHRYVPVHEYAPIYTLIKGRGGNMWIG
jgi:hypothetical protein